LERFFQSKVKEERNPKFHIGKERVLWEQKEARFQKERESTIFDPGNARREESLYPAAEKTITSEPRRTRDKGHLLKMAKKPFPSQKKLT